MLSLITSSSLFWIWVLRKCFFFVFFVRPETLWDWMLGWGRSKCVALDWPLLRLWHSTMEKCRLFWSTLKILSADEHCHSQQSWSEQEYVLSYQWYWWYTLLRKIEYIQYICVCVLKYLSCLWIGDLLLSVDLQRPIPSLSISWQGSCSFISAVGVCTRPHGQVWSHLNFEHSLSPSVFCLCWSTVFVVLFFPPLSSARPVFLHLTACLLSTSQHIMSDTLITK